MYKRQPTLSLSLCCILFRDIEFNLKQYITYFLWTWRVDYFSVTDEASCDSETVQTSFVFVICVYFENYEFVKFAGFPYNDV